MSDSSAHHRKVMDSWLNCPAEERHIFLDKMALRWEELFVDVKFNHKNCLIDRKMQDFVTALNGVRMGLVYVHSGVFHPQGRGDNIFAPDIGIIANAFSGYLLVRKLRKFHQGDESDTGEFRFDLFELEVLEGLLAALVDEHRKPMLLDSYLEASKDYYQTRKTIVPLSPKSVEHILANSGC